jgi:hypothetical protein
MGQLVFSSLSRCHLSSQGVSLCRSSPEDSFDFASVLIFRRCLFLRDLRRRSRPPIVAPSRCQIVFRNELDPWKNLSGFRMSKVRKTPSLSSLSRNDLNIPSARWSHHKTGTRDLVIRLLAHYGPPFSGCGRLFSGCERLDDLPSHLQHYINGRVGVKLPQHLFTIALLCCRKFWPQPKLIHRILN